MTQIRLRILACATVTLAVLSGVAAAGAPSNPDPLPRLDVVDSGDDADTWACLAVDHVHVGACVENPFHEITEDGNVVDYIGGVLDDR